jgi:hypothetical protein
LWRLSAEQGYADAEFNLGVAYMNGFRLPEDHGEAARWFQRAANQGHADAQFYLGQMYLEGDAVPQNSLEAYKWFSLAIPRFAEGDEQMRNTVLSSKDALAATMTPEQIAIAEANVEAWLPN